MFASQSPFWRLSCKNADFSLLTERGEPHHYSCVSLKPFTMEVPVAVRCEPKPRLLSPVVVTTLAILAFSVVAHASAYVRVNQVGYVSNGSKRAYLMSSAAEAGATFVIKNSSGSTVFGPTAIGANLGSWSSSFPAVYGLDFDTFSTAGTYTISVSGPLAATSPSFKIDTAANVYSGALANSLNFYQDERDGANIINTGL